MGPPAPEEAVGRRSSVAAVAQAARRALHRHHRVERELEPGRRARDDARLGVDRRLGAASGGTDDRVDLSGGDHRPPLEEELRQLHLGQGGGDPARAGVRDLLRRRCPSSAADLQRHAALPGQEPVVAPGAAGKRAEGDVVLVLLHRDGAVGRAELAQKLPGERAEEPLGVPPRFVGGRLEARDRQRTDHVVVVAAERDAHHVGRGPVVDAQGRVEWPDRDAVDAAVEQRGVRPPRCGEERGRRLVGQRRADLARHLGHGPLDDRRRLRRLVVRVEHEAVGRPEVHRDAALGDVVLHTLVGGRVDPRGDRAPTERVQQLVEAVGVVGGVERVE